MHCIKTITVFILSLMTIVYQGCVAYPEKYSHLALPKVTVLPLFSPEVYNRIAIYVVDRTRSSLEEGALQQVEDEFMHAVIEKGYILAARSDIKQVAKELDLQASSFTEEALARKAKVLNVSAILLVSINELSTSEYQPTIYVQGQRYYRTSVSISARLISAELSQVVWISSYSGTYEVNDRRYEHKALAPAARIVAKSLPSRYADH